MPSPHTLVVYGFSSYIQVYHIPDIDLSVTQTIPIPIAPVWSWVDTGSREEYSRCFHIKTVWDPSCKHAPIVRLVSEDCFHFLNMEAIDDSTRLMVAQHDIIRPPAPIHCQCSQRSLVRKYQKALWFRRESTSHGSDHDRVFPLEFPLVNLNNPFQLGSVQLLLHAEYQFYLDNVDFDEGSGRILLVSSIDDDRWCFQFGDIMEECGV